MAKSDWDISGPGGQSVIEMDGSKRCQLSGKKFMLWNGRSDLADGEVIATIKPYLNENGGRQVGGMLLRCDASVLNYYVFYAYGYTSYRKYYIYRVVNGVGTLLAQINSSYGYNIYVKTRFRVDGWQLSLEEYIGGVWNLITVIEDTDHSIITGYAGLIGSSYSSGYFFLFDDIEISEKA